MPKSTESDIVIIGGGPAGLTAALYAARRGMKTIVLNAGPIGGQMATTPKIENYPGFDMISGAELADRMKKQAEKHGAVIKDCGVVKLERDGKKISVKTAKGNAYLAKAVIITTGAKHRTLDIPGEAEFLGKGVSNCTTCDGPFFKGRTVAVVGGGNTALTSAIHLASIAKKVYIVHRRDEFRGAEALVKEMTQKGVEKVLNVECVAIKGDKVVKALVVKDIATGKQREIAVDGVFINVGITPTTAVAESIGVELAQDGSVKANENMQTTVPGIFAAGDIIGRVRQIVTAAGGGAIAGLNACKYIRALEGKTVDIVDW